MNNDVIKFKMILSDNERHIVKQESDKGHWELSGHSQDIPESRTFWYKDLMYSSAIIDIFTNKVETHFDRKIRVNRVYANGQAHGQCGLFHQDTPGCQYSLVYYPHTFWKPEYGGHLLIRGLDLELHSIWPEPNSAVLFRSDLWHCPLEPTVHCKTQRESIAFKFSLL